MLFELLWIIPSNKHAHLSLHKSFQCLQNARYAEAFISTRSSDPRKRLLPAVTRWTARAVGCSCRQLKGRAGSRTCCVQNRLLSSAQASSLVPSVLAEEIIVFCFLFALSPIAKSILSLVLQQISQEEQSEVMTLPAPAERSWVGFSLNWRRLISSQVVWKEPPHSWCQKCRTKNTKKIQHDK